MPYELFDGVVKRLRENSRFCYIESAQVSARYGRDAYCKGDDLTGLDDNMKVDFLIDIAAETPRAVAVEIIYASGQTHVGIVKSVGPTYAIISCPEVSVHFGGVDVFAGERHLRSLPQGVSIGMSVRFTSHVSFEGRPQATHLEVCDFPNPFRMLTLNIELPWHRPIGSAEVVLAQAWPRDDFSLFDRLADEISFQPRLRGTHSQGHGCERLAVVSAVVHQVCELFRLTLASAKVFRYRDGEEWRPFHQDAHAHSRALRQQQDTSCIASFGATRTLRFEHLGGHCPAEDFDMPNGSVLAFGTRVNEHYRHGLPRSLSNGPRISIAIWGMLKMSRLFN